MNTFKLSKVIATSAFLLLISAGAVFAAGGYSSCEVVYGGGEVCPPSTSFTLNKLVKSPTKGGDFVENLTINDSMFDPTADVVFKIVVKNTGKDRIDSMDIVDTLPNQLTFSAGTGTYNSLNKTLTIKVQNLDAGREADYFITTKVDSKQLNADNTECATNSVKAADNRGNKAEDTANFCILKNSKVMPVVPTKNIPNTGPEALALVFLPPAGLAGLYLRRKAGL